MMDLKRGMVKLLLGYVPALGNLDCAAGHFPEIAEPQREVEAKGSVGTRAGFTEDVSNLHAKNFLVVSNRLLRMD